MKIIIAGAGQVGGHLAKMLSFEYHDITIIDHDESRLFRVSESADVITINGRPTSIEMLKSAGVEKADLFIAVSPSEEQDVNLISAMLAKKLGAKKVTARVNNDEYMNNENKLIFTELGIDLLFYPEQIAALEIADLIRQSSTSEYLNFSGGKLQLIAYRLNEESLVPEQKLSDHNYYNDKGELKFRIVAISREGNTIIPNKETRFKLNDLIFILSTREGAREAVQFSGKDDIETKKLMILGGGRVGEMVAKRLENVIGQIKLIERDRERAEELSESLNKVLVVRGDGRNSDLLLDEDIRNYDTFVAVTNSSETNILSCVAAKNLGIKRVIAEVENNDYIKLAEGIGVDSVINKKMITAGKIFRFTMSDKVRLRKSLNGADAEIIEFNVNPDSMITKHKIRDLDFPKDAIIGGYIRRNESHVAVGDTLIEPYDRVVVFALPKVINKVDKFFM